MLEVRDLAVAYGKIRAVRGVSIDVAEGEIVALIGANGTGKSSTLNAISGVVRPAGGSVHFDGETVTSLGAHRLVGRGIVQVPEGRLIFAGLSVLENLMMGAYGRAGRARSRAALDDVLALFPVLAERLDARGADLSGGQAQMLALARGLMAGPRLLLLDEPSLGLAPLAVQEVFGLIHGLRERGLTILLVEQNLRQALKIADRGYVLEGGKLILEGRAEALLEDDMLVSAYLGVEHGEASS